MWSWSSSGIFVESLSPWCRSSWVEFSVPSTTFFARYSSPRKTYISLIMKKEWERSNCVLGVQSKGLIMHSSPNRLYLLEPWIRNCPSRDHVNSPESPLFLKFFPTGAYSGQFKPQGSIYGTHRNTPQDLHRNLLEGPLSVRYRGFYLAHLNSNLNFQLEGNWRYFFVWYLCLL